MNMLLRDEAIRIPGPSVPPTGFTRRHLEEALERMRELEVLVIGESIVDEYIYCDPLGKSGKEPILVMRYRRGERQAGGSLAIANHAAAFSPRVRLLSALGERREHEDFIRGRLRPEVEATFIAKPGAPTIVKRRYLDPYSLAKFFGVYEIDDEELAPDAERDFLELLRPALRTADVVVVADYGHGLITEAAVNLLCESSRFLAVNTQLNAANAGFHTISRYPRADYVCIHELELRLDARDRCGDLEDMTEGLVDRMGCEAAMVTLGKKGTLLHHRDSGPRRCPALAREVVERVGAGDAVFTTTSIAVAARVDPDLVNLFGNLAGAQAVRVVGNAASIVRADLFTDALRYCVA